MKYLQRVLRIEKNLPAIKKKDLNLKVVYLERIVEGSQVIPDKPADNGILKVIYI